MPVSERPFSDRLMEAAARIDELPSNEVARLLIRAAVRLRLAQSGTRVEHIPVAAYHLLRRLSREAVPTASLHGREDEALISFLLTRHLAEASPDGSMLTITAEGEELGTIADELNIVRLRPNAG